MNASRLFKLTFCLLLASASLFGAQPKNVQQDPDTKVVTSRAVFNEAATYTPALTVGQSSSGSLAAVQEFHQNPAIAGGEVTPTDFVLTPKASFATNPWVGMTLIGGTNKAWPYIEFLGSRGTLASPAAVVSGDMVGELATIACDSAGHYRVSSLIDFRVIGTVSGAGVVPGQIEFVTVDSSGAFKYPMAMKATGVILNGTASGGASTPVDGGSTFLKQDTYALQIRNGADNAFRGIDVEFARFGGTTSSFASISYSGPMLKLRLADDTGFADVATGRIGIGTTSVSEQLTIHTNGDAFIRWENASGTFKGLQGITANNAAGSSAALVGDMIVRSETRVLIDTGGTTRLIIDGTRLTLSSMTTINMQGSTPASSSAAGMAGDIKFDGNYIYYCVATNTWKRVALSTW